jgi:hypothetical protein
LFCIFRQCTPPKQIIFSTSFLSCRSFIFFVQCWQRKGNFLKGRKLRFCHFVFVSSLFVEFEQIQKIMSSIPGLKPNQALVLIDGGNFLKLFLPFTFVIK